MPRRDRDEEEVPSAVEAMEDDQAREERAEHGEAVQAEALAVAGASTPAEVDTGIPFELRPGQVERPRPDQVRPGDKGAPKTVEQDPVLLNKVQDPYNERKLQTVPMVNALDSYGNIVEMPV